MKRIVATLIALSTLIPAAAYADLDGLPAEITVHVIGCQQYPLDLGRVLLLGTAEADELGNGDYRFAEVYPGEYELFVYSDYSDSYREKIVVSESSSKIHLNVMVCICVECVMPVIVNVVDSDGKRAKNAHVSVPSLFLEYETDKKGRASFGVPAGEWDFIASADGSEGSITGEVPFIDPAEELTPVEFTITIR